MAKGYGGFPGGMNMNNLMKQAQKMQQQMVDMQAELEKKEYEATSGGGAVKVVVKGNKTVSEIKFKPDVVDPDDVEMLEDLVLTAVNEALRQAESDASNQMGKFTGGMNLPGGLF